MPRLSLADVSQTCGLSLADLATASGVSEASVKQLEQSPPQRMSTWLKWRDRIRAWLPLLGSAFAGVIESRALETCPPDVIQSLRNDLLSHLELEAVQGQDAALISPQDARAGQGEQEYLRQAYALDAVGCWDEAERRFEKASLYRYPHEHEWLNHRLSMAQMRVNRGVLLEAEKLVEESAALHQIALRQVDRTQSSSNEALAEAVVGWAKFLRGKRNEAIRRLERAANLARLSGHIDIMHTGLHMGARAVIEPSVIRTYLSIQNSASWPKMARQAISGVEEALNFDSSGTSRQAFGFWYKGVLLGLYGDTWEGRSLMKRAGEQLSETCADGGMALASHAELSLVHLDILACDGHPSSYVQCESQLRRILEKITWQKFPYAMADASIAFAFCAIQRGTNESRKIREVADRLCVALIAHPYPDHPFTEYGRLFLFDFVLPALGDEERTRYIHSLCERVSSGENPFGYLKGWKFDLQPLDILLSDINKKSRRL